MKTKKTFEERLAPGEIAARCHEIQTGLGLTEVPEFDNLRAVGMAVRLALHIQGLPSINYRTLRLVAIHFLEIPSVAVRRIVEMLAEVEFVKIVTEGKDIKAVVPTVPYYETLYETLGEYARDTGFAEAEQLSIDLLSRLSRAPEKLYRLRTILGADTNGASLRRYASPESLFLSPKRMSITPRAAYGSAIRGRH